MFARVAFIPNASFPTSPVPTFAAKVGSWDQFRALFS
jgi:hypothetical protein